MWFRAFKPSQTLYRAPLISKAIRVLPIRRGLEKSLAVTPKKTMPPYSISNDIVYGGEALSASDAKVLMQPDHFH